MHLFRLTSLSNKALLFMSLTAAGYSQPYQVSIKIQEPLDSARDGLGHKYAGLVMQKSNLGGVEVPKDSPATVTLAKGAGSFDFTMVLTALVLNGKEYSLVGHNPTARPPAGQIVGGLLSKKGQAPSPIIATPHRIAVPTGTILTFTVDSAPSISAAGQPDQGAVSFGAPAPNNGRSPSATPDRQPATPPPAAGSVNQKPGSPTIPARGNLAPEPGVQIGDPSAVFVSQGFRVRLVGCTKDGTASVTCDFQVTNIGEDGRRIGAGAGHGYGVIDSKGQAIAARSVTLANTGSPWVDAAAGIAMPVRIVMAGVDPDVSSLFRVPFSIRLFPASFSYFEWRNISLNGAGRDVSQAPRPASQNGLVVEVEAYRFTALRCNSLASNTPKLNDRIWGQGMDYNGYVHLDPAHPLVECFFRVENSKANREIILDGVSLIGIDGNTYDQKSRIIDKPLAKLGWLGEEPDYQKASTIPYAKASQGEATSFATVPPDGTWALRNKYPNTPMIEAANPKYFWAAFVGPPSTLTEAAQIRFAMRTGRSNGAAGYSQISVVFRNIPITPFSKDGLAKLAAKTQPTPTAASVTAEVALDKFWQRTISKCGASWYRLDINDPYRRNANNPLYTEFEYKNAKLTPVKYFPNSPTDKMNGLQWKATNMLQAGALRQRVQNEDRTWSPLTAWRQFLPMENPVAIVQKKNGMVSFQLVHELAYEELDQQVLKGPACSDIN